MSDAEKLAIVLNAMDEILRQEKRAWMPVRVFRSQEETAMDDERHAVWTQAAEIVRDALKDIGR